MRLSLFVLTIFLFGSLNLSAGIQAQMWYCTFYNSNTGPYIEVYFTFQGDQLALKQSEDSFYGEIEITYTFTKNEEVIKEQSFIVQSPEVLDTHQVTLNFVNQHRIPLPNGDITMDISIRDLNRQSEPIQTTQELSINYNEQILALSDIEIYQNATPGGEGSMFYKNGYRIIPYTYEIVPPEMNQLGFYVELYNASNELGDSVPFLITYYLQDYENGHMLPRFRGHSRKQAEKLNVFMGRLLIGTLPGGNYNLVIDVLNKENELLTSKKIAFHKQNPDYKPESYEYSAKFVERYESVDSLGQHIKFLAPISDQMEVDFAENQIINRDLEMMKKYFLNFWEKRNPKNPELEWYEYLKQVYIVNDNFSSPMREGYLTDRGWRYLKYGPPNNRFESFDEPLAFPYEVWYYNQVNNQSNRIIIFYNKSQVLNEYVLLHSDINGELRNKDWNLELHRMNPSYYDVENPGYQDYFGNKTEPLLQRTTR